MNSLPTILVISIQNSKPETLIKSILRDDLVTASKEGMPSYCSVPLYSWKITNKYYSTEVQFHPVVFDDDSPTILQNSAEAVIVFFDNISENFLTELRNLNDYFMNMKPAIRILTCGCSISETNKQMVENWCVDTECEFVELNPIIDEKSPEDDFGECFGIARVIEILHAHQWPNLVLNDETSAHSMKDSFDSINAEFSKLEDKYFKDGPPNQSDDETDPEKSLEDVEQLSALFQDLAKLKQNISSLNGEMKLKQAENVVKAFWRAMNGDSDEFSESEDEP